MEGIYGSARTSRFPKTVTHALTVQAPTMTFLRRASLLLTAAAALLASLLVVVPARAEEPPAPPAAASTVPHPFAYGILVGTNVGGAGQQTLRYAEDDARKMADVLRQLGRYGSADLRVLVRPDGARLLSTIDEVAAKMRAHQAKGEQAVLVFYYSGHARAGSFSLGGEELAASRGTSTRSATSPSAASSIFHAGALRSVCRGDFCPTSPSVCRSRRWAGTSTDAATAFRSPERSAPPAVSR